MVKKRDREKTEQAAHAAESAPETHRDERDPVAQIQKWIHEKQRALIMGATAVGVIAVVVWFTFAAKERRERFALSELENARISIQSGNLALAASDLTQLVQTYGGTTAGDEAAILLARVRLLENQAGIAAVELRNFLAEEPASQFRAPAYSLLASALEATGNYAEAAEAYEVAAEAAWYDFLKADYLNDAGRVRLLAGDTTAARAAYQRVIDEFPETQGVIEARVRASELGTWELRPAS